MTNCTLRSNGLLMVWSWTVPTVMRMGSDPIIQYCMPIQTAGTVKCDSAHHFATLTANDALRIKTSER